MRSSYSGQKIRTATLLALVLLLFILILPAFSYEVEESNDFMEGINAYQRREFNTSIVIFNKWLKDYPDSLNRDVAIYWLSRSYLMTGNKSEADNYMSQFIKEYPDSPLLKLHGDELLKSPIHNEKGKTLNSDPLPAKQP